MTRTVLIVNNNHTDRIIIESILEGQGYRLESAANGAEALEKARRIQPDAILLDVTTPAVTDFEVCLHLRDDHLTAEIPIIFLAALGDKNVKLQGLQAGANDYITKPYDHRELRARLGNLARLNSYRKLLAENIQRERVNLLTAYDATIAGWSRALELRDKETDGHSHRVTELTLILAREIGIEEEELVHIRRGSLLHDMGKLGVPDAILGKTGSLTEAEMKVMRRHPQYAYDMLSPIEYLRPALDIPYSHHEKWDGSGYPQGLKGEEIPLSARVFAVADVWDALTTDRPYRPAWSEEMAVEYIRAQSGKHFDPRIAELFCKVRARLNSTVAEFAFA